MSSPIEDSKHDRIAPAAQVGPANDDRPGVGDGDATHPVEDAPPAHESVSRPEHMNHHGKSSEPYQRSEQTPNLQASIDLPAESTAEEPSVEAAGAMGQLRVEQDGLTTDAKMADDGRVQITIDQISRRFSKLLQMVRSHHVEAPKEPSPSSNLPPPQLNIVIQVVGSRGDVQPFVALGKTLKEKYHHRVRLATHATFKGFVEQNGLEFFNIGGDPAELMAFMVKNPGLMPGFDSLRRGDVGKRQKEIYEILLGCWRSCIEIGDGMDDELLEDDIGEQHHPFVADVIIANPPSFAHIHCAEKLGIPLHLMFTMPWSPTQVFPHPLASVHSSNADPNLTNLISYTLVESLTWQGLGHVINRFRQQNLRLESVSLIYAPSLLNRLQIPYTYCWSPALIPKPKDWGPYISVSGFYFLSLASSFTPDPDLTEFLEAGPPPVYIGFGSIVVDDPDAMTTMIFAAIKKAGVRALVSKGWGGLGKGDMIVPAGVYMLGNIPHDWLFKRVSCVVHHGGAGTTAAGIALGKPTVVVPFFGDQPFWGAMIARAGAGPFPVPYKALTADILAASITEALQPTVQEKATNLAASIAQEEGTKEGAKFFHSQLHLDTMRCSLAPNRAAVWRVRRTQVRLSALATAVLIHEGLLKFQDLKLCRPQEYDTQSEPLGPISGVATGVAGAIGDLAMNMTDIPIQSAKAVRDLGKTASRTSSHFASGTASSTLTPAVTTSSRASTLISGASDRSDDISTTQSDRPTEATLVPTGSDLDGTDLASAKTVASEREGTSPSIATSHRSFVSHFSSKSSRSPSEGSSYLSPSSNRAPIGSENMEQGAARTAVRFIGGAIRSPMDLTWTLARGFNNAPKSYGDTTVRKPDKVTDLQSGIKMAGKGFGYGFYDGFSGLVTQPLDGAKSEGVAGFVKGVGKGLGGVVLKPGAAIFGVPGYIHQGIYKELRKGRGKNTQEYIIAARTVAGLEDLEASTQKEREQIVARWEEVKRATLAKKS